MNYGLYLSASGVLTSMHRQDVIANNLANASTVGFKRDLAAFSQRLSESAKPDVAPELSKDLLDRLGGTVLLAASQVDTRDGGLRDTGNSLDLALTGPGFFHVQATDAAGQTADRLTRDGRLTLADNGELVTTVGRHRLLDTAGRPITLDRTLPVQVDQRGGVRQGGSLVAELRLAKIDDPSGMRHTGNGLYAVAGEVNQLDQADGRVLQGWLEDANVDPVREMVSMIEASRAISHNSTLIRYHDSVMERAVNVLGRVA